MCFSAGASFGASVVLAAIGVVSTKKASTPQQKIFAGIPFVFAVQQLAEGFAWLSLTNSDWARLENVSMYSFLFFAHIVWPAFLPFAVYNLEPKGPRKKVSFAFLCMGIFVSLYFTYCLLTFDVQATISGHHIAYIEDFPKVFIPFIAFCYVSSTVGSSFFSRIPKMWILGTTVFLSYWLSRWFYKISLISIWCFFASIISMAVLMVLYELNTRDKTVNDMSVVKSPRMRNDKFEKE